MTHTHIAVDFGGGSGRVIAGSPRPDGTIDIREIYRFSNGPVTDSEGRLRWDFTRLCREMTHGLRLAASQCTGIVSIAVDTWGVDFGLINPDGTLAAQPLCYRDTLADTMIRQAREIAGEEAMYRITGLQPDRINSVYRLMLMARQGHDFTGQRLLFMPDLFNHYLTGVQACEYTEASTSGMLDAATATWSHTLLRSLSIPTSILPPIVRPGHSLGHLRPEIIQATGLPPHTQVICCGSHDTASAVSAIELDHTTAFLSSGTWSLLGLSLPEPVTTQAAFRSGYANEGGTQGILFLQNITGLWLLQQLQRIWTQKGIPASWDTLTEQASNATYSALIDVDDPLFTSTPHMDRAIEQYCTDHGMTPPATVGQTVLTVLRSLAARYAHALTRLENISGHPVEKIHIIGGGVKNTLLTRLTAEATGRQVISGPAEATSIGNIRTQILHYRND